VVMSGKLAGLRTFTAARNLTRPAEADTWSWGVPSRVDGSPGKTRAQKQCEGGLLHDPGTATLVEVPGRPYLMSEGALRAA